MAYKIVNPIKQFNFQINRILTYGNLACDVQRVEEKTAAIRTFTEWETVWSALGEEAEQKQEYLRAAYYYRMAEFFLLENNNRKSMMYEKCIHYFYRAFDTELYLDYEQQKVPFEEGFLNCIELSVRNPRGTVLVCGGYDSFIEEFVLQVRDLASCQYNVILFEGPGQGRCLQQNMYFRYDFEKVTSAVLDWFHIEHCTMVGISWGGYFSIRCAAFEKRISSVVAYDVMDDGFEVMTHVFPTLICKLIRMMYRYKKVRLLNVLVERLRKRSVLANWAVYTGRRRRAALPDW